MVVRILLIMLLVPHAVADTFRVGLANIYFMSALFDNNLNAPIFNERVKNPPTEEIEAEFDRLSRQMLTRYLKFLQSDILVLCEVDSRPEMLEKYVSEDLDNRYTVIHNSPVVKDKKFYNTQQIAALVDKSKFLIRRYEAHLDSEVTPMNGRYPFPDYKTVMVDGKEKNIWWSRFPIEFDVALKSDPTHWYKVIGTYPKSKFARSPEAARMARISNRVQQEMIRERVEAVASEFEDIIVLGDMNDSLGMDEVEKELNQDALSVLYQGKHDPILWNPVAYLPGQGTYIYQGVPETIDFIFVSHGLKSGKGTTRPKVWEYDSVFRFFLRETKRSNPDRLENRELFVSDHGPVTIDIRH
ncbi:MAG: endonuclease/exonuclease/phosphatase family protein [Candidatus Cloacimonetes bacterium]|nr:endonuclease/exonuclease/phosphatase family protein [Candidatus Cloacimonadota bacterium]